MAVQFILGRSGTGKTHCCIRAIVKALTEQSDQQLILLVPEQATYQAERAILADERIAGYNRLNVLSFDRLQFLLLGKNTAMPRLSRIGRQMIVHRILCENQGKLKLFGAETAWSGISRQMARTITELQKYANTPDDVDRLLSELAKDQRHHLAALKFADIGLVFKEFMEFIEGDFIDPDAQLMRACGAVSASNLAKGSKLWVDGFAGFTTAEFAILAELLKMVKDAHIALCLDPSNIDLKNPDIEKLDELGLFNPTERVYCDLFELIKKSRLKVAEPLILSRAMRFSKCRELTHVERHIFELKAPKMPASENVRTISAPNEREEVRFVGRQILRLVKEKDFRYRDIAVIASDIDRYEHYIRAYFDDYGIPFFIDKRRPLNHHPVVQIISSALQTVIGGFMYGDIFAYLKTDLVPINSYEIDLLENYCLAFGISARDWQSDNPWRFAGPDNKRFDERQINGIRMKLSRSLLELRDRMCPADEQAKTIGAEEFTRIIFDFLDQLNVKETIAGWIKQASEQKDLPAEDEHRQFYNQFLDIFDELVEVFAGQAMKAEDYLAILHSAFAQMTLAFIPPALDQVLVGSIERSRHPDLRAVFLIGATQKQFPAPFASESILTDEDRIAAESVDFPLAATLGRTLAERQYLAYIAFTRPSEYLWVTYPSIDEKGAAVPRSQFIGDLESLFEDHGEESIADMAIGLENVHSEAELADLLCGRLGRDNLLPEALNDRQYNELLDAICSDEQLEQLGSKILYAINYNNRALLETGIVKELFGRRIKSSATRLGTFAACPYQYFARYILDLKERQEFKFEPLDLGSFYHRVLDALLKRLGTEGKGFAAIENGELITLLKEEIEKITTKDSFISNFVSRRGYNEFIINSACSVLEDCVMAIAQMVRAGNFRPKFSEVSFGRAGDAPEQFGNYELVLPDKRVLSLEGKIDRLDFADLAGKKITLVFDYKRRDTSFGWSEFCHGLDMQLPIYMLAVRNASDPTIKNVAGAFYMPIEVSPKKATLDELSEKGGSYDYKAKGIFDGQFYRQLDGQTDSGWSRFYNFSVTAKDQQYGNYAKSGALKPNAFEAILYFAEKRIIQLAQEIVSGRIDASPYRLGQVSPCGYCKYKSVCRFDWQINNYNFLESLSKSRALEEAGVING
ncbi:MAG: PD-(D/E)XK nuclease family protein [Planctomycetota bacterium]|jgi:ATP-dependent helicase/nuclease subunit B